MSERLWGKITTRPVEKNSFRYQKRSCYEDLIAELLLRLEQTPAAEMLDVPFEDASTARRARAALRKWFTKNKSEGYVRLGVGPNEVGGWSVLVARGPAYPPDHRAKIRIGNGAAVTAGGQ